MPVNRRDAGYWWVALFLVSLFTIRTGFWILEHSGGYGWVNVSKDYVYQQYVNEHKVTSSSWDVDEVDEIFSDELVAVVTEAPSPLEEEAVETADVEFEPKEIIATQDPEPTNKPFRRPRLGMRRIQREKEHLQKLQEEKRSKYGDNSTGWGAINEVVYEPVLYDRLPHISVKLAKDGSVDTTSNRIFFYKDDWYSQFQFYREFLGNRSVLDVSSLENYHLSYSFFPHRFIHSKKGISICDSHSHYGVVSNVCLIPYGNQLTLYGENADSEIRKGKQTSPHRDFYCSRVLVVSRS